MLRSGFGTANIVVVIILVLNAGCSIEEQETRIENVTNLIPLMSAAETWVDTGDIPAISSFSSEYFQFGFGRPFETETSGDFARAVTGSSAVLAFNVNTLEDRLLQFEFSLGGPSGNLTSQKLQVLCNGTIAGDVLVETDGWGKHTLVLKREKLHQGQNQLEFKTSQFVLNYSWKELVSRGNVIETTPIVRGYLKNIELLPAIHKGNRRYSNAHSAIKFSDDLMIARQRQGTTVRILQDSDQHGVLRFSGKTVTPGPKGKFVKASIKLYSDTNVINEIIAEEISNGTPESSAFELKCEVPETGEGSYKTVEISVVSDARFSNAHVIWEKAEFIKSEADQGIKPDSTLPDAGYKHIVIITLDALRANVLGVYGADWGATPNIDKFARDAFIFDRVIAAKPMTQPSVVSMFTGLLPEQHGVFTNGTILVSTLPYLPEFLQKEGYRTAMITGNKAIGEAVEMNRGVDIFKTMRIAAGDIRMDMEAVADVLQSQSESEKRTFTYIHFLPPHTPRKPPAPFDTKFTSQKYPQIADPQISYLYQLGYPGLDTNVQGLFKHYLNNTAYADSLFGETINALEETGMLSETLLILISDHGEAFGEHKYVGHNEDLHEEMVHVPMIIKGSTIPTGRSDTTVGLIDLFPSVLDFAGIDSKDLVLTGRSLRSHIEKGAELADIWYYSVAQGFSVTNKYYKLNRNTSIPKLYDMQKDKLESMSLFDENPLLARYLQQIGSSIKLLTPSMVDEVRQSDNPELLEELKDLGYLQ